MIGLGACCSKEKKMVPKFFFVIFPAVLTTTLQYRKRCEVQHEDAEEF
jgi:hypothetical protein